MRADRRGFFQSYSEGMVAFVDSTADSTLKVVVANFGVTAVTSGAPNTSIDATAMALQVGLPLSVSAKLEQRASTSRAVANRLINELGFLMFNMVAPAGSLGAATAVAKQATTSSSSLIPTGSAAADRGTVETAAAEEESSGSVGEIWKCKSHESLFHDVFIPYRVWSDKDLSLKLALHLDRQAKEGGRGDTLRVFLDRHCLNDGEDWEMGFLYGLQYAAVTVLLVSGKALQGIMQADQRQDNVLLEYEYAIKGEQEGHKIVLPLFVNNDDFSPFVFPDLSLFPEGKHNSPKTLFSSVRETMRLLRDSFSASTISPTDRYTDCTETILSHVRQAELKGVSRRLRAKALLDPSHTTTVLFACPGGRVEVAKCRGNIPDVPRPLQLGTAKIQRVALPGRDQGKEGDFWCHSGGDYRVELSGWQTALEDGHE